MQEENIRKSPEAHIGPDHQLPPPHDAPRKSGFGRAIVWIALLAAFGLLFYFVLHHKEAATATAGRHAMGGAVTATVVTAKQGDIGVYLDAIGTVTPVYTDSLTAQVQGLITAVNYREGQMVHKGQSLIQIDARPYQANLLTAQGTLERDQNILAQAKMDLTRYQTAWARNAIPKQTLDDQEKIVLQDEGTVKTDQGTVAYDKVQVSFCNIFAPVSGRVGLRIVDPGNVVTAGGTTTLAVVTQLEPITIIFTVAQDSLADVMTQLRQNHKLNVDAYDRAMEHKLASGTLSTVDNLIDTATGTVKMRATFANKDSSLFPNQFVNTRLLVRTIKNATLIPNSAIQRNGDQAFVYRIVNGKAMVTDVKPGTVDGLTTAVTGINPGDVLADSSFEKLQDGSEIHVSTAKLPGSGSSAESNAP